MSRPILLDLFCGRGGWSEAFARRGWSCVGVDINPVPYPFTFRRSSVLDLQPYWIDCFDAVVASPPCEEFARAWLPWLRGDRAPAREAIRLLRWAVALCDRPRRLVECSQFARRYVPGGTRFQSHVLWGDVPLLMPFWQANKERQSGSDPSRRAVIPYALADTVAQAFTNSLFTPIPSTRALDQSACNGQRGA